MQYKFIDPNGHFSIQVEESKDNSSAFKKCHSQFTDSADYRRPGLNTWQDESGTYANSEIKQQTFKASNPIPDRLL